MKDHQAHLEKLRKDAAECAVVRDSTTDHDKREMFDRLSKHLDGVFLQAMGRRSQEEHRQALSRAHVR
jgi:hypothetical protein